MHTASLLAPLALLPALACRSSGSKERPPEPILGPPLVLHGSAVPWDELRAAVCEGHAGVEAIEHAVQRIAGEAGESARIEHRPAPGVLCRVNGTDVTVREIWGEILPELSETDVREAKLWLVDTRLLRTELERAGAWLTDEEAGAAYRAHSDPYKDSVYLNAFAGKLVDESGN